MFFWAVFAQKNSKWLVVWILTCFFGILILDPKWEFCSEVWIPSQNWFFYGSLPCKIPRLFLGKITFFTVVLHSSFNIFAQNWIFYNFFPCKRVNLSHHQIDFVNVVFLGSIYCYFCAKLNFHCSLLWITLLLLLRKVDFFTLVFFAKDLIDPITKLISHCSFSWKNLLLFMCKLFLGSLPCLSLPCISLLLFLRKNWIFCCSFSCKRLNLSHSQIVFLTVVFPGKISCYFCAKLHFSQ